MPNQHSTLAGSPVDASVSSGTTPAHELFAPVLARLRADGTRYLGSEGAHLIPVAYQERPFSHLLRLAVCHKDATHASRHLFIKVFKPKPHDGGIEKMRVRVAHDFDVTRRIFDAMSRWDDLGVVRPIVCDVDHLAIVTEQAEGETLLDHLQLARWFPSAATRQGLFATLESVGRWLRAFQTIDRGKDRIRLSDLRAYVDVRLRRLVTHGIYTDARREQVLAHLDALANRIQGSDLADVIIHADFAPGNILVKGSRVIVLDLAMVQRGTPLHDLTRLYLQLDVLRAKPPFRAAIVRALQAALLRGFDPQLAPTHPLFRYLLLLHRTNHLATLSLKREPFPANALSRRVRQLHQRWISEELRLPFTG